MLSRLGFRCRQRGCAAKCARALDARRSGLCESASLRGDLKLLVERLARMRRRPLRAMITLTKRSALLLNAKRGSVSADAIVFATAATRLTRVRVAVLAVVVTLLELQL